jgi:NOL1/NOP2/fmu family ribosome biogenesis protein
MKDRFGIKEDMFDGFRVLKKNKGWWLHKDSAHLEKAARLKVLKIGIKAFEEIGQFVKPTTRLIQLIGCKATKARFELSQLELRKLVAGERLPVTMALENGYIILLYKGQSLGLGLLIHGELRSQLPVKEIRVSMV